MLRNLAGILDPTVGAIRLGGVRLEKLRSQYSGTDGDETLRANRTAFDRLYLRAMRMADVILLVTQLELTSICNGVFLLNALRDEGLGFEDVVKSTTLYVGDASAEALHENMRVRNACPRRSSSRSAV